VAFVVKEVSAVDLHRWVRIDHEAHEDHEEKQSCVASGFIPHVDRGSVASRFARDVLLELMTDG